MHESLTFVQSRAFTEFWESFLDDDDLLELQQLLVQHPDAGDPLPGCGVLRKIRVANRRHRRGKRGGFRVIYMHTPLARRIDLLVVYPKSHVSGLHPGTVRSLCATARRKIGRAHV